MNANNNPWIGLLSYQDPYKTKGKEYVFCGRDAAVSSIFSMIDNSILVTLYGKTGIGKTSVLNAGVCPILRSQGYLPILIRLGTDSFAKTIVSRIEEEVIAESGRIETQYPDIKNINDQSVDYLWKYLCTTSFFSKDGTPLFPVVILDQFEEIFISANEKSTLLLKQINALIDDNKEIPEEDGYSSITNYRFVISIREDDLFYLEDAIDANYLSGMKQNRYRLAPLKESEAVEIIALGKEYFEESEFEEIAKKIIKQAKDENGQISTNILSLVCSQIFIRSENKITLETLNKIAQNPLESFYDDCINHISSNTKNFIEERLVENDRRRFVKKEVFDDENNISPEDRNTLTKGQYRIIQEVTAGNIKCVELIHDSIARTIFMHKISEQEKAKNIKRKKRNQILITIGSLLLLFGILGLIYTIVKTEKKVSGIQEKQQRFSINFYDEKSDLQIDDIWRATVSTVTIKGNTSHTIDTRKINDQFKDSSIYFVTTPVDSVRISMVFDKLGVYYNIDTTFTFDYLTQNPVIKLPIRKIMPKYTEYSSMVTTNISGVEVGLSNAIVVIRNIVQRTSDNGAFTLALPDSINNTDILYIIKEGFTLLKQSNFVKDSLLPEKFVLNINTDFQTNPNYLVFDSICTSIDSMLDNSKWWTYGYNKYKHGGYLINFTDGHTDRIIILSQRKGKNLKGVYWYASEYNILSKNENKHYAYHIFEGTIDNENGVNKGESASFEITGYDIFNNKQTITGTITYPGTFAGTIESYIGKEILGSF